MQRGTLHQTVCILQILEIDFTCLQHNTRIPIAVATIFQICDACVSSNPGADRPLRLPVTVCNAIHILTLFIFTKWFFTPCILWNIVA